MTIINYQEVFGVPLGNEVQESHGVTINRHHARLAVDITLSQASDDEEALGIT